MGTSAPIPALLRAVLRASSVISLAVVASITLASCGAHNAQQPDALGQAPGDEQGLAAGLPALSDLPQPRRDAAMLGPGWTPIAPADASHKILTNGCTGTPTRQLVITGGATTGYAIFAVQGFDGDAYPTSIRTTLDAADGPYYVGFSDYVSGRWRIAGPFTNSAEVQIPGLNSYSSPTAYTNPSGVFYFVLLVGGTDTITLNLLEVGTFGGTLGPAAPMSLFGDSGASGIMLTWNHSPDYHRPDFAGYLVQRAPLLSGDFAALNTDPIREAHYLDDAGLVAGEGYRYRLAALDSAGNMSAWADNQFTYDPTANLPPVPVVKMQDGPLYAPANVLFDLSDSFDPEGDAITGYDITFGGILPPPVSFAGPTYTATLQPGCYSITIIAHTAGGDGQTTRTLKVYPRWDSTSFLVRDPDPDGYRRMREMRGYKDPVSGQLSLYGQDGTYPGYARWFVPDPPASDPTMLPCYEEVVDYNGEPIAVNGTVMIPVAFHSNLFVAIYESTQPAWADVDNRTGDAPIAMVADPAGHVWTLWSAMPAAQMDLKIASFLPGGNAYTVAANITHLRGLDAVYNPAKDAIEVVYADTDSTEWIRWSPLSNDVVVSGSLAGFSSDRIDLELCPDTGLPLVAFYDGMAQKWHTRSMDSLDDWTPDQFVDNSVNNRQWGDLAFAPDGSTPEMFFGTVAPQAYLYEYTGGVWNRRNTVSYSSDSGYGVALLPGASGRQMLVADALADEKDVLAQLNEDGSDSVLWSIPGGDGQGLELHSAAANDGLHVGWKAFVTDTGRHFQSLDGETWNDMGSSSGDVFDLDLAATTDGELYASSYDSGAGLTRMMWWDGTDFQSRFTFPGQLNYRPFFAAFNPSSINWFSYEPGTMTMHHVIGNEIGGYADFPGVLNDFPVWDGVANILAFRPSVFAEAGNAAIDESPIGLYAIDNSSDVVQPDFDAIANSLLSAPEDFLNSPFARGRVLGTASYLSNTTGLIAAAYWGAFGDAFWPVRYVAQFPHTPELSELPWNTDLFGTDLRRTVSVKDAHGFTAVALLASFDGSDTYCEWSNFGDWEQLPLPAIPHMSGPELLVGRDGRWHIIYKDYRTDQIRCVNSR